MVLLLTWPPVGLSRPYGTPGGQAAERVVRLHQAGSVMALRLFARHKNRLILCSAKENAPMDLKSATVIALGLVLGSAIICSSQVWIGRGELARRVEAAEQRQAEVEQRLEKLAPAKGMPPGRWRLIGTAKLELDRKEHLYFDELDTGNLYSDSMLGGKLWQLNVPKEGKQPKVNGDPGK
jgi:hypothetical protein